MWHVRKGAYVIQFPYVGSELMWQDASIEVEEVFVGRVVDVLVDVSAVGKSEEDRTERSVQLAEVLGRYRRLECCLDSYLQSLCGAMLTVLSRSAEIDGFESSQFVLPPEGLEFLQPEDLGVQILSAQNTGNVCVLVAPLSPERYMVAVPIQRRLKWNKARLKRSGICCDEVVEIIRREVMGIF
ncbi:MAG: hypothetical protein R3C20_09835 [Planctomycetaceae bacterium]